MQLNIIEIEQPELDPYLVGRNIADQFAAPGLLTGGPCGKRPQRAMQAGAEGIKIIAKGRISGAEIARTEKLMMGAGSPSHFAGGH